MDIYDFKNYFTIYGSSEVPEPATSIEVFNAIAGLTYISRFTAFETKVPVLPITVYTLAMSRL